MRRRWGKGWAAGWHWGPPKPFPRKWGTRRRIIGKIASGGPPARGWTVRRPRKLRRGQLWILSLLLLLFLFVQTFLFFDRKLRGPLMFLAKFRITQMATEAINTAITREIMQGADAGKLIQWKTNPDGKVSGFVIDYKEQMKITAETIRVVEEVLKRQQEMPERIPIGHALNSPLISAIGPSVSIAFRPASAVKADVGTRQTSAGINMLLVEVYIRIRTEIAVIIPFDREPDTLETEIPLSYALVVGDVPMYYYDGNGHPVGSGAAQAPAITLPEPQASSAPPT